MTNAPIHIQFAQPDILNKFLKDTPSEIRNSILPTLCNGINQLIQSKLATGSFDEKMLRFNKGNMDNETYSNILMGVKNYLQSQDLNFPGKYNVKEFFFSSVKAVSESNFLNEIYKYIDDELSFCQTKSNWNFSWAKSIYDFTVNHPFLTMSAVLFACINAGSAANANINGMAHHDGITDIHPTSGMHAFSIKDAIYQDFHVITNAPFDKVKYFGFLETHIPEHHQLISKYVNALGSKGDILLLEGLPAWVTFNCSHIVMLPEGIGTSSQPVPNNLVNFDQKLTCMGWDNKTLLDSIEEDKKNLKELSQIQLEVSDIFSQINQVFIDFINLKEADMLPNFENTMSKINNLYLILEKNQISKLKNMQIKIDSKDLQKSQKLLETIKSYVSLIQNMVKLVETAQRQWTQIKESISSKLESIDKDDRIKRIQLRNRNILSMLEKLKHHQGKFFIFAGVNHFIPPSNNIHNLAEIHENDLQFEARHYLNQHDHMLVYPKAKAK